jgi:hypothetical protein
LDTNRPKSVELRHELGHFRVTDQGIHGAESKGGNGLSIKQEIWASNGNDWASTGNADSARNCEQEQRQAATEA